MQESHQDTQEYFPLENWGGGIQTQVLAPYMLHFGSLANASQVSRGKQTCLNCWAWNGGFCTRSQHFLALFPFQAQPHAYSTNMSKASGLKPSICSKKNEVFKQDLFGVV